MEYLCVKEKKTDHIRKIKMTTALKQEIEKYIRRMSDSDYLFPSRKGNRPISRETAWRIIRGELSMKQSKHVARKDRLGHIQ